MCIFTLPAADAHSKVMSGMVPADRGCSETAKRAKRMTRLIVANILNRLNLGWAASKNFSFRLFNYSA
jgi:hypothetical protein